MSSIFFGAVGALISCSLLACGGGATAIASRAATSSQDSADVGPPRVDGRARDDASPRISVAACAPGAGTAAVYLKILETLNVDWHVRAACEARLEELPPSAVLPLVSSDPNREAAGMRSGPFCNSGGSPEVDSSCSPPWQVVHALERIFAYQLDRAGPELALRFSKQDRGGDGAMAILDAYLQHPDAHPDIASLAQFVLADGNRDPTDRNEAAFILLRIDPRAHYRAVADYVATQRDIIPLIDALVAVSSYPNPRVGADRRIVRQLFEELEAEVVHRAVNPASASPLARALGDIVNVRFEPDPGEGAVPGSSPATEAKTVDNARAWWRAHATEFPPIH